MMIQILISAAVAFASPTGITKQFRSPNGKTEVCIALSQLPGAIYSIKDADKENAFCAIDLYAGTTALCPKFWSTSAATMVYDIAASGLTSAQYESARCATQDGHEKLAKFKNTMNAANTSGTFSPSSLLYYHFSRYFSTSVSVPVAVFRTIDKDAHYDRVASKGRGTGMNAAAWTVLRAAELNPASYTPTSELFTTDREQIYGAMLKTSGERYGAEFNGTRASGWGDGQNRDFQNTPGFSALRAEQPLLQAIQTGLTQSKRDPLIVRALGTAAVSNFQMMYWMKEITEITILDYIFSQQDRIGNIDYEWTWYYIEAGRLMSMKEEVKKDYARTRMAQITPPAAIAAKNPVLLQRSNLNDNDAGASTRYANFTKRTQMLEKIRHINADTYRQLIRLKADVDNQGPIYTSMVGNFGLSARQAAMVATNIKAAADIIKKTCTDGLLRFDLDPKNYALTNAVTVSSVNCAQP